MRPLGLILKSFARANALSSDSELLQRACAVLVEKPLEHFDAQSCTDIVFALAQVTQQGMLTYADVCWRMLTYADVC